MRPTSAQVCPCVGTVTPTVMIVLARSLPRSAGQGDYCPCLFFASAKGKENPNR